MNLETLELPERTGDAGFQHVQKLTKLRSLNFKPGGKASRRAAATFAT